MIRKRTLLGNVHKKIRLNPQADAQNEDDEGPKDVESTLSFLASNFSSEKFPARLPPIVLKHQIYAFLKNRTEVDKELNEMRKSNKLRLFKLGSDEDELAIVLMDDFKEHVRQNCDGNNTVENFMKNVVTCCPDVSYSRNVLLEEYKLKEDNISELIQNGLLTARDIGCYWLSIPQVGAFVKTLIFGRKALLQHIRRTKYKEILQSELEQRKLPKKALLSISYHIYDIIGSDGVKCVQTSTGTILRLTPDMIAP